MEHVFSRKEHVENDGKIAKREDFFFQTPLKLSTLDIASSKSNGFV